MHDVIALCLLHSRRSQVRRRKREHEAAQDDADRQREEAELAAKRQKLGDGRPQSIYLMECAHTHIHMYGQMRSGTWERQDASAMHAFCTDYMCVLSL